MKTKHVGTLGSVMQFYFGRIPQDEVLEWPPDVFAIAAKILKMTGSYTGVVNKWPPRAPRTVVAEDGAHNWNVAIRQIGREWREAVERGTGVPREVRNWWTSLIAASDTPLGKLSKSNSIPRVLLQLVAAADEACAEIGIPSDVGGAPRRRGGDLAWRARALMRRQNFRDEPCTLCREIPSSLLAVLPKLHTPTNGTTLRSLTHHLALHDNPEISVRWTEITTNLDHTLNVLCVPWPLEIRPVDFGLTEGTTPNLSNLREDGGFFDFEPPKQPKFVKDFQNLLQRALSYVGSIDAVVFPELAVDAKTFQQLRGILNKMAPACCLIAGVGSPGRNQAFCSIPDMSHEGTKLGEVHEQQDKHHRWKLDRSQIEQYGLGGRLDAGCSWWESTEIQPRTMNFFSLQPWLTLGVLICEDLARQDPAGDLMRSVGPNLVISLLMDGPQLASRWSARYATVLADDPGSSVLTLSSLGMVLLSKPFDKPASRVVGLWKDYKSPRAVEIELPPGKTGVVLSLTRRIEEEFSADGRSDEEATAYLMLTGMHSI